MYIIIYNLNCDLKWQINIQQLKLIFILIYQEKKYIYMKNVAKFCKHVFILFLKYKCIFVILLK